MAANKPKQLRPLATARANVNGKEGVRRFESVRGLPLFSCVVLPTSARPNLDELAPELSKRDLSVFEADNQEALGKINDSFFADPDVRALITAGGALPWTTSVLVEVPLD